MYYYHYLSLFYGLLIAWYLYDYRDLPSSSFLFANEGRAKAKVKAKTFRAISPTTHHPLLVHSTHHHFLLTLSIHYHHHLIHDHLASYPVRVDSARY